MTEDFDDRSARSPNSESDHPGGGAGKIDNLGGEAHGLERDLAFGVDGVSDHPPPLHVSSPEGLGPTEGASRRIADAAAVPPTRFAALRTRLEAQWSAAPPNLRGSVLMVAAYVVFTVMTALIKIVGSEIPVPQILVVRQIVMSSILFFILRNRLRDAFKTDRHWLQVQRGLFSIGAMTCGFTALIHMPIAEATAIGFSQVLFVTLGAILILGEVVDKRRWLAMVLGFAGVLIMLRPGSEAMNIYALLSLAGAMFGAGITITVRILGDRERTETILLWQGVVILTALTGPAIYVWQSATPGQWLGMVAIGVVGTAGQWLITRAYQVGEASALAPLDFVRLLLATLTGFLVFAELPAMITLAGAALVVWGTVETMRSNRRHKHSPSPPPAIGPEPP